MDCNDKTPWRTLIHEKMSEHLRKSKDKRRTKESREHHSGMIKYFERLLIEYEQSEKDFTTEIARGHTDIHSGNRKESDCGNNNQ